MKKKKEYGLALKKKIGDKRNEGGGGKMKKWYDERGVLYEIRHCVFLDPEGGVVYYCKEEEESVTLGMGKKSWGCQKWKVGNTQGIV